MLKMKRLVIVSQLKPQISKNQKTASESNHTNASFQSSRAHNVNLSTKLFHQTLGSYLKLYTQGPKSNVDLYIGPAL